MREFSLYRAQQSDNAFTSYDGLDAMRVISSVGVVLLHVAGATGVPGSLEWLIKFRDFALPVMVMSSFFVLTLSLVRRSPENDFRRFAGRRFSRIFLPLIIWTFLYILFIVFLVPLSMGAAPTIETFSPIVFLTGYIHLWYLQFIFIGSILIYPVIVRNADFYCYSRARLFLFCAGSAVLYGVVYRIGLQNQIPQILGPETDISLQIFVEQVSRYSFYIPVAVGLGFISGYLEKLFKNALVCRISLLLALSGMLIHVGSSMTYFSQEIYAIAVFLAALQPWKKIPFDFWQRAVDYSYGIYIVHFFWVHLLWLYIANYNPEISSTFVLCTTPVVYLLSLATAVLIRKFLPFDWLLPLVRRKTPRFSLRIRLHQLKE